MNSSEEYITLKGLNDEEVRRQIPLMVYLAIVCVSGTVGNALVCYIFTTKYKHSIYRTFVTALSVVDLFLCCIAVPIEFTVQFWQYTMASSWLCKLQLFLITWATLTSVALLLCIAFVRYRKVCKPHFWQVSAIVAKRACFVSAGSGLVLALVSPTIYDIQTSQHDVHNITISQCGVTEIMNKTLFPLTYNIVLVVLFIGALICIIYFYCRIAVRVKKQTVWRSKLNENCKSEKQFEIIRRDQETLEEADAVACDKNSDKKKVEPHHIALSRMKVNRTTFIMFMVSLAFIISFVPIVSLLVVRSADTTFVSSLKDLNRAVYRFFLRSYFLNSVVNPLIYGILDERFRKYCKLLCSCRIMVQMGKIKKGLRTINN